MAWSNCFLRYSSCVQLIAWYVMRSAMGEWGVCCLEFSHKNLMFRAILPMSGNVGRE